MIDKVRSKEKFAREDAASTAELDGIIGRILASEEPLIPSSGFAALAMERVREEAAAPAPIPFPWKRILPGAVVAFAALAWAVVELARALPGVAVSTGAAVPSGIGMNSQALLTTAAILLALAAPLLAWRLARRMIGTSGLF